MEIINTSGRRKTSVARIYLKPGKGQITINNKDLNTYFVIPNHQTIVKQALTLTNNDGNYDILVNVKGGGVNGQASAVRLAIAKALVTIDAEYKKPLRDEGMMTRDSRMVERKKPGQKKARKKFQFSKR